MFNTKPRSTYRLPDGKTTKSADRYIRAWRKLARPIERGTCSRMFAYDPGLAFASKGVNATYTWHLGTHEAILLSQALTDKGTSQ